MKRKALREIDRNRSQAGIVKHVMRAVRAGGSGVLSLALQSPRRLLSNLFLRVAVR